MALWFGLALMTAAAVWAVLWPLARRRGELRSGSDVAVYREQLTELERDREAGLIGDNEAAAARVEVSRRLIAAADPQTASASSASSVIWQRRSVAIVALVLVPFGAAALYLDLGSPSFPDQPLAPRLAPSRESTSVETPDAPWIDLLQGALARVEATAAVGRQASDEKIPASPELSPDQRNAMIEGMVERLSERLHRDGADPEGWLRLVRSYMVLGQPAKARAAAVDARRALEGDATKLRRLDELLKGLGLKG